MFLKTPNIPAGPVVLCALAEGWPAVEAGLSALSVEVLAVPAHTALSPPVSRHADLQLHHLGGNRIVVAQDSPLRSALEPRGFACTVCAAPLGPGYPADVALCGLGIGGRLYAHPAATAPEVRGAWPELRPVRQGYARCGACVVDESAIITADRSIAAAAEADGLAVLRIRPGYIELPGYPYGFIGGCGGLIDRKVLALTGDIDRHPDGAAIRAFCGERGVAVHSLTDGPLLDVGGVLPLLEE